MRSGFIIITPVTHTTLDIGPLDGVATEKQREKRRGSWAQEPLSQEGSDTVLIKENRSLGGTESDNKGNQVPLRKF